MLASPLPTSFLDVYSVCHLWDVRLYAWSFVFLFLSHSLKIFLGPFQEWSRISYKMDSLVVYPFDKISACLISSSFLVLLRYSFLIFFPFRLFDDVCFQYF